MPEFHLAELFTPWQRSRVLVTSQFIAVNLPKTGSSFVRAVIKRIHARRRWRLRRDRFLRELMLPRGGGRRPGVSQHGWVSQIPDQYRHLPVMAVIRNPYDRLLSAFEYRWWVDHPNLPSSLLQRHFPHFPDLSLADFIRMRDLEATDTLGENPLELGIQTIQFVSFFFREPDRALRMLSDDYVESGAFKIDMADLHLLRQERLREGLAVFLRQFGYREDEIEVCHSHPAVNSTVRGASDRASLWTQVAIDGTAHRERYLFAMLRQMGIDYVAPEPRVAEAQRSSLAS